MKKAFDYSVETWNMYWGESYTGYLLAVCIAGLLILGIRKKRLRTTAISSVMLAFVFFFPFTARFMTSLVGHSVYWRALWTIPHMILIPLFLAALISLIPASWGRIAAGILGAALILFCGSLELSHGRFTFLHNPEKVPDTVAQVGDYLKSEGLDEYFVATDNYISSFLRVYDPSIHMPYGRRGDGAGNDRRTMLYQLMETPYKETLEDLTNLANAEQITHLVMQDKQTDSDDFMRSKGWERAATIGDYIIYRNAFIEMDKEQSPQAD